MSLSRSYKTDGQGVILWPFSFADGVLALLSIAFVTGARWCIGTSVGHLMSGVQFTYPIAFLSAPYSSNWRLDNRLGYWLRCWKR